MFKRLLPITAVVAFAALPMAGAARGHITPNASVTDTFTYSLVVNAACTITLASDPNGTVSFTAISALSAPAQTTADNPATVYCSANSATLNIYDGAPTSTTNYTLTSGAHTITFGITNGAAPTSTSYTNSSNTADGVPVPNLNGTVNTFGIYGQLPVQGVNAPGTYTDLITTAVTFS